MHRAHEPFTNMDRVAVWTEVGTVLGSGLGSVLETVPGIVLEIVFGIVIRRVVWNMVETLQGGPVARTEYATGNRIEAWGVISGNARGFADILAMARGADQRPRQGQSY